MDKIYIDNLMVYARYGVYDKERELPQRFNISATLYCDISKAGKSDDLEKTINYGEICKFINDYTVNHSFHLIETLACNLATELLKDTRGLKGIKITIMKPEAPVGLPVEAVGVSIERWWHTAYLSLGSNLGEREAFLDMAVDCLEDDTSIYVSKVSDYIETKPYGYENQDDFINACLEIKTIYSPTELLAVCQSIENKANRERKIHWGPRTLDIDILFYDDEVIQSQELQIPHPEIPLRSFVLEPLAQIAPYLMHPVLNKRISELLALLQN